MGLLGWSIAIQKTEFQRLPEGISPHAKMIRSRLSCTGTTL
jgi:hypothetical protein